MAQHGNINLHTKPLEETPAQKAIKSEAEHIDHLSGMFPLRLRISGDQPDQESLEKVTRPAAERYHAKRKQPVWTYTHNWRNIEPDSWGVISALASVHSMKELRAARAKGYAAALLLPEAKAKGWKDGDEYLVQCPGEWKGMLCIDCKLCWKKQLLQEKNVSIVFTPHGQREKHIKRRYADGVIG